MFLSKIFIFSIVISFFSCLKAQQKDNINWIDVSEKSDAKVEKIILKTVNNEKERPKDFLKARQKKLNQEKLFKEKEFNIKKDELNNKKNDYHDKKSTSESNKKDQNTLVSELETEIISIQRKIEDSKNSIEKSKNIINNEKDLVETELTKIKFNEVVLAVVRDIDTKSDPSKYYDAMKYEIAKAAVSSSLGDKIINTEIIENDVLTKSRVEILRQGKVNEMLKDEAAVRDVEAEQEHDRYLYGLVDVYPFQEKNIELSGGNKKDLKNIEIEVLDDDYQQNKLFNEIHPEIKVKIQNHINAQMITKNTNNKTVKNNIKGFVFKPAANMVPSITPIITNTP